MAQNGTGNPESAAFKEKKYDILLSQMQALLEGEHNTVSILSNASALLMSEMGDINWVGFYLMNEDELILGPFQGKPACMHIAVGKGVCGTAVSQNEIQVVPNVHKFPGHIACDSASNSEIVIPLRYKGRVVGVLDIDSPSFGRFDAVDALWLEKIARVIEEACNWDSQ
ncbi:MAG: GAF domain-containing protein [Bacillota bacterium]